MRVADIGRTIIGIGLVLVAAGGTAMYIVVPLLMADGRASGLATIGFAVATMGGGLGALLVRDGLQGSAGKTSRTLSLPRARVWLACAVAGLILGAAAGRARWAAYLFPPFHVLTLVGWTGFLLSLLSSRLPGLTEGDATVELAYGSFVATAVGGSVELILFLILGVGAYLLSAIFPIGREWIAAIQGALSGATKLGDLSELSKLVMLPPVAGVLGVSLMIGAPLAEECLKGLGALLGGARPAQREHYLAWGLLSGLGFGLMESLVSAATMGSGWAPAVLMRFLTIVMHGLTGALMGMAWFYALRERRPWLAMGLSVLCLAIHALWNGTALAIALLALQGMSGPLVLP